jgi:hypothetical protein
MKPLKLRTIAERRHNGGQIVKVYELGSSGTFTLNLPSAENRGGLEMFASAEEAQRTADERFVAEGHDCGPLGCRPWVPPASPARKSS